MGPIKFGGWMIFDERKSEGGKEGLQKAKTIYF
jgi:hypothetical protein